MKLDEAIKQLKIIEYNYKNLKSYRDNKAVLKAEAIETVLKEYKELKISLDYIYEAYQDIGKDFFELKDNSISKDKIRAKIEEVEKQYKEYVSKWEKTEMNKQHPFYTYITRLDAQIDILKELLEVE